MVFYDLPCSWLSTADSPRHTENTIRQGLLSACYEYPEIALMASVMSLLARALETHSPKKFPLRGDTSFGETYGMLTRVLVCCGVLCWETVRSGA